MALPVVVRPEIANEDVKRSRKTNRGAVYLPLKDLIDGRALQQMLLALMSKRSSLRS